MSNTSEPKIAIWDRECKDWGDRQKIYLGHYTAPAEWFKPRFHVLRKRTNWLKLIHCRHCSAKWYVGIDTIDDDYYFQRLSDEEVKRIIHSGVWPDTFDSFPQFWPGELTEYMVLPKPQFQK